MELNENFVVMEATRRAEREIGKILSDLFVDLLKHEEDKEKIIDEVLEKLQVRGKSHILPMLKNEE